MGTRDQSSAVPIPLPSEVYPRQGNPLPQTEGYSGGEKQKDYCAHQEGLSLTILRARERCGVLTLPDPQPWKTAEWLEWRWGRRWQDLHS